MPASVRSFTPVTLMEKPQRLHAHLPMWACEQPSPSTSDNPLEFESESTNHSCLTTEAEKQITTLAKNMAVSHRQRQGATNGTPPLSKFLLLRLMCKLPAGFKHMFIPLKVDTAQWDPEDNSERPGLDSHCHSMAFLFISCFVQRFIYWFICSYVCKAASHCSCWTWVHSGCYQHFLMAIGSKEGKSHQERTDWSQRRVERQAGALSSIPLIVSERGGSD